MRYTYAVADTSGSNPLQPNYLGHIGLQIDQPLIYTCSKLFDAVNHAYRRADRPRRRYRKQTTPLATTQMSFWTPVNTGHHSHGLYTAREHR